jgi:hypothetical protein
MIRAIVLMVAAVAASSAAHAKPPHGVVENCSTQSGASFPGAYTSRANLVVGPLALIGARGAPAFASTFHGNKFPLLVRNGHRVTLELSLRTRRNGAGLAYGPLPQGDVVVGDAHRVVRFIACGAHERTTSDADGRPVTFWSGGIVVRSPRCVPVRVWIDGARAPRLVVVRLGVARCV